VRSHARRMVARVSESGPAKAHRRTRTDPRLKHAPAHGTLGDIAAGLAHFSCCAPARIKTARIVLRPPGLHPLNCVRRHPGQTSTRLRHPPSASLGRPRILPLLPPNTLRASAPRTAPQPRRHTLAFARRASNLRPSCLPFEPHTHEVSATHSQIVDDGAHLRPAHRQTTPLR
jgi:hypothetical protein